MRRRKRGIRFVIVVEDEALERIAREVLKLFNFTYRDLRVVPFPKGRGSNKDFVNSKYAEELAVFRSKPYITSVAILVGTDADEMTIERRSQLLDDVAADKGLAGRTSDERIAFWIPKWNVETWLLYLTDKTIRDENANYKHTLKRPDFRACAREFVDEFRKCKAGDQPQTQPSLQVAYSETLQLQL